MVFLHNYNNNRNIPVNLKTSTSFSCLLHSLGFLICYCSLLLLLLFFIDKQWTYLNQKKHTRKANLLFEIVSNSAKNPVDKKVEE